MCCVCVCCVVFFQAEDGIRDLVRSRVLGDVYKRQVLHGSVKDGHSVAEVRAVVLVQRQTALLPRSVGIGREHQVLDAHVGKGASPHHLVVAAARPVAVEVGRLSLLHI